MVLNLICGADRRYRTATSSYLCQVLKDDFQEFVVAEHDYERAFDKFEYIAALVHLDLKLQKKSGAYTNPPVGSYSWRSWGYDEDTYNVANEVAAEIMRDQSSWAPLRAGLFGGHVGRLSTVKKIADDWLNGPEAQSLRV